MTILFNANRPVKTRKPFGMGIARPNRERLAPFTSADLDWLSASTPCPATAPTDAEWADEFERRTMSAAEYRALRAEARIATLDRYARAEAAEMAEMGIDPALLDELARESAELDAICRGVRGF